MAKNTNPLYLSYVKVFLSEWHLLANSMAIHLAPVTGGSASETPHLSLLTNHQIDDAINGPFGYFYRTHMDTYMRIKRRNFEARSKNETAFTSAKKNISAPGIMPDRKVDIHAQRPQLTDKALDAGESALLEGKLKQLDKYFKDHLVSHKRLHQAAYNETIKALNNIDLPINDFEKGTLCADEPLSEILSQLKELNIALPTNKIENNCYFTYTLKLKLSLVIHSALSRKQLPHTEKDIKDVFKKLKDIIGRCKQFERKTNDAQDDDLALINKPLLEDNQG